MDWSSGDAISLPLVNNDGSKTYTITFENAYSTSSDQDNDCEFTITYSSEDPDCAANNSVSIESPLEVDKCYKYTIANSGNWYVGNFTGTTVEMTYWDCSGTSHDETVYTNYSAWSVYSVGTGACTIYVRFKQSAGLQFNSY
jgi:hypothetical protein